ncbi:MAG: response regulator [Betaproteobacteria bacterium]
MNGHYKILMVEDSVTDVELVAKQFERAQMGCDIRRVDTAVDFLREIREFQPEAILSDLSMPRFDGMEALAIARRTCPDVPFIFVSGTLGEENALRVLREGATDYILKNNLQRLGSAVDRAIKNTHERRARRAMEQELRESERRYRILFHANPHPIIVYDAENLRILAANDGAIDRYGFTRDEFLAMTIDDLHRGQGWRRPDVSQPRRSEQHVTKNGGLLAVEITSASIDFDGKQAVIVVASILQ